jgi:1,6-anhydro-N-acetylmuramate kinase
MTTTPTLKDRHRATGAAGDYAAVAERLVLELGRTVVTRTGIGPDDSVLDVATGTGNAAIPAAAASLDCGGPAETIRPRGTVSRART